LLLLAYACALLYRKRSRRGLTESQARASRLIRRFKRALAKRGVNPQGRTAEELLHAVTGLNDIDAAEARELVAAYNNARFGPGEMSTAEYRRLSRYLRRLPRT
jgi:hypothetical protein